MSQWTHVSGVLRIDAVPQLGITPNLRAILGTPSTNPFLDDSEGPYRSGENIPSGSEGSLQYAIADAGNGLVWKTVAVWGDLRDFGLDETPEIDAWFHRIIDAASKANLARSKLMLRAAQLLVEVEGGPRYMLVLDDGAVRTVELSAPSAGGRQP